MLNEQALDLLKSQVLRGEPITNPHKHFLAALIEQHKQAVLANEFYLWPARPDGPVAEQPAAQDVPRSNR